MEEIRDAIRVLAKHNYRSMSNIVGEYVEKRIAEALDGVQAGHCMKGFDVLCANLGKVEVKSRNADAKSMLCQLPAHKLDALDHFVLAIVRAGEIEKVILFSKETLLSLRRASGKVYIDRAQHHRGEEITDLLQGAQPRSTS